VIKLTVFNSAKVSLGDSLLIAGLGYLPNELSEALLDPKEAIR